jgi:FkbM family methyltransferase
MISADERAETMTRRSFRKAVPPSIKRRSRWLAGWGYSLKRRLRPARMASSAKATTVTSGPGPSVTALRSPSGSVTPPDGVLDFVAAANEHGAYCVPRSSQHRPVAQAILRGEVWEAETLDLICGADCDGDVIHAGTFFGDFLPLLARSRSRDAVIWAFEPNRENYRCAQVTILLNDLQNLELANAGLGAESAIARLATGDREGVPLGGASRVIKDPSRVRWWPNEEVNLVSVDQAVAADRRVAVIHLDVEGHEQEALTGALRTIARCRPLIVVETLPGADWLAANLEPLGYRVEGDVNRNSVLSCR